MDNKKVNKIIPTDELDDVLPKYEPVKLSGKNLAQQYVSAFNTGMNIYQCINQLQGSIVATVNGVNNVVKSWNDSVGETINKSIEVARETTTGQFNKEWENKQPELIEQVNTLTTTQFNKDFAIVEGRIDTTLETQNTNIEKIQHEQSNLIINTNKNINEQNTKINSIQTQQTNLSSEQTTLKQRMDTFTKLAEGSTTSDAELIDIRVGVNGITYNTAGDAVRDQHEQLSEYLRSGQLTINEFDVNSNDYTKGYFRVKPGIPAVKNSYGYYDANICELDLSFPFNLYNYIEVNKSDFYFILYNDNVQYYSDVTVSVYDVNKEFLGVYKIDDFYKSNNIVTIPSDDRIKYIRIPVSDARKQNFLVSKYIKPTKYLPYLKSEDVYNILSLGIINQWYGKTWYAYGTSLTNIDNEGKYCNYVRNFSGMKLVNKGINGGGLVASDGNIRKAIMNIVDGKLNADLITLETGANDTDIVLGSIYDTVDTTYCGALNQCIRYLQANTNAQIVVISSTNARYEVGNPDDKYTPDKTFGSDNHTKYDQWKAIEEVCKLNSVQYIPMGEHSGLGFARMDANDLYNVDQIHHTELGGYNLGKFVWSKLKDIPCWYSSLPSNS